MKISRTEKQKENIELERFVSFAPGLLDGARSGRALIVTDDQRNSFAHVQRFLERELQNRLTKGRHKKADDGRIAEAVQRFNNKELSLAETLASLKISRATFYRYLNAKPDAPANSGTDDKTIVFSKLAEGFAGKISSTDLKHLRDGLETVENYVKATKIRRDNLREGRKVLEQQIKTDENTRERIKKVRARNALTAVRTRPKDAAARGGETGGRARAKKLTSEERKVIARSAAESRWDLADGQEMKPSKTAGVRAGGRKKSI